MSLNNTFINSLFGERLLLLLRTANHFRCERVWSLISTLNWVFLRQMIQCRKTIAPRSVL